MKVLSVVGAVLLLAALAAPAEGSHPTQICLDVLPERAYPTAGDDIVDDLGAHVGATDDDHEEPHQEGCVTGQGSGSGSIVDFEIDGKPDPDESFSPESPDMTCAIPEGDSSCFVFPPGSDGGEQIIHAWIDFDADDSTVELDVEEAVEDEDTDATDVVLWTWTQDCCGDYRYDTTVTIRYSRDEFAGLVRSGYRRCEKRWVIVRRERRGEDQIVGRAQTDDLAEWNITRKAAHGRYYANVRRKVFTTQEGYWVVCTTDRSPVIQVR